MSSQQPPGGNSLLLLKCKLEENRIGYCSGSELGSLSFGSINETLEQFEKYWDAAADQLTKNEEGGGAEGEVVPPPTANNDHQSYVKAMSKYIGKFGTRTSQDGKSLQESEQVELKLRLEDQFLECMCSIFPNPQLTLRGSLETGPVYYHTWSPYYSTGVNKRLNLRDIYIAKRKVANKDHSQRLGGPLPSHMLEPSGTIAIRLVLDISVEWSKYYNSPIDRGVDKEAVIKLLQGFLENDATNKDFTIVAGNGAEVKCHSFVLEGQSAALTALVSPHSGMMEAEFRRTEMKDMSEAGVRALLRYLYCLPISTEELWCGTALELFQAGHKYDLKELEDAVHLMLLQNMEDWFTPGVALELYYYVRNLKAFAKLRDHSMRMLARMADKIRSCDRYKELSGDEKDDLVWKLSGLAIHSPPEVKEPSA